MSFLGSPTKARNLFQSIRTRILRGRLRSWDDRLSTSMCFIGMTLIPSANMNRFNRTLEFEREYRRLSKRYRSLAEDLAFFEGVLYEFPTGNGSKFVILHNGADYAVLKARLMCRALRDSSLRIIYVYHKKEQTFCYLELYYKGDNENEDRERIKEYLKSHSTQ